MVGGDVSWVLGESLKVQFDEVVCNNGLFIKKATNWNKTHPTKTKPTPQKKTQNPTNQTKKCVQSLQQSREVD